MVHTYRQLARYRLHIGSQPAGLSVGAVKLGQSVGGLGVRRVHERLADLCCKNCLKYHLALLLSNCKARQQQSQMLVLADDHQHTLHYQHKHNDGQASEQCHDYQSKSHTHLPTYGGCSIHLLTGHAQRRVTVLCMDTTWHKCHLAEQRDCVVCCTYCNSILHSKLSLTR